MAAKEERYCATCGRTESQLRKEELPLAWNPSGYTCAWCDYRIPPIRSEKTPP